MVYLSELIEFHAVDTYGEFVDANEVRSYAHVCSRMLMYADVC
jgi:hypothetical protein